MITQELNEKWIRNSDDRTEACVKIMQEDIFAIAKSVEQIAASMKELVELMRQKEISLHLYEPKDDA